MYNFEYTAERSILYFLNDCDESNFILLESEVSHNRFSFIRGIQSSNNCNVTKRKYNVNPMKLFRALKNTVKKQYKFEKSII